jgi:ketosteroid isomerase-like protein
MGSDNLDVVKRELLAYLGGDYEGWLAGIDPGIRVYPRPEEPGADEVYVGHDAMFEYMGNWLGQWDEYSVEPVSYSDAPGGRVLVVMMERGHMERSGIRLEEEFSHSFSVEGGMVTEWRMYDSHAQALEHLGVKD